MRHLDTCIVIAYLNGNQTTADERMKRGDSMKWKEIEQKFDGQWVLIECFDVDSETFRVLDGEVLYHSQDMGRVYTKLLELKPKAGTIEYIGKIPEAPAVVL